MNGRRTPPGPEAIRKARTATYMMFFVCGTGLAAWAPMVPLAKQRLGVNEAELGLLLLSLGAGAIVTMPFTGQLVKRTGSRIITLVCGLAIAAVLPLLTIIDTPVALGVALFAFGSAIGGLDVAMNAQALVLQEYLKKHIMSSIHALFCVGGLFGAFGFGYLLTHFSPVVSAILIASVMGVISLGWYRHLADHPERNETASFSFKFPKGPALTLGLFCFVMFLAEGAMLDWSALFIRDHRDVGLSMSGLGYAVFSLAMAIMRLTGDRLVHRFGERKIVLYGAVISSAGLLVSVLLPYQGAFIGGFFLMGFGAANIVPVVFSAAGKIPGRSPESSIATITTLGYSGQLAGPAIIGFIAELTTLPVALGLLALPILFVGLAFRQSCSCTKTTVRMP